MELRTIGTLTFKNYSATRNVLDLPHERYRFREVFSWPRVKAWMHYKRYGRIDPRSEFLFNNDFLPARGIKLYHFFNGVSSGRDPWLTSFESFVPYWGGKSFAKDMELLVRDECKAIIPISEYAKGILRGRAEMYHPRIWDQIEQRITVIHPPQRKVLDSIDQKQADAATLSVALVGSFFFNKGGLPLLRVAKRMIRAGKPLKVHIVSSMTYKIWNETNATDADYAEAMQIISTYPQQIHFHERMPNAEVLEMMKGVDVGLLPSVGDTYGYSVLEAMSSGCPVITTDAFAFEEVNADDRGWIIPIPKDSLHNPLLKTEAERRKALQTIEEGLEAIFESLLYDRDSIRRKGTAALAYVTEHHSVLKNTAQIGAMYDRYWPER